ncbi:NADH-quinone oxidoreductase subunit NuoK [Bdellovibrionota bacterium]
MFNLINMLLVAAFLFSAGMFVVFSRRDSIGILMGVQLFLSSSAINFVAFSRFVTRQIEGHMVALFILIVAAIQVSLFLAIVLRVYKERKTSDIDEIQDLRE